MEGGGTFELQSWTEKAGPAIVQHFKATLISRRVISSDCVPLLIIKVSVSFCTLCTAHAYLFLRFPMYLIHACFANTVLAGCPFQSRPKLMFPSYALSNSAKFKIHNGSLDPDCEVESPFVISRRV